MCYENCPEPRVNDDTENICSCNNNYYNNSNEIICFNDGETCESKEYKYINEITKECFLSIDDCVNKGFKYIYNCKNLLQAKTQTT